MERWMAAQTANDGNADVYQVGAIDARIAVVLGLPAEAATVRLHANTIAHIVSRRSLAVGDAGFVFQNLPLTIHRPDLVGAEARDSRRFRFVKFVATKQRHLHVSLKLVSVNTIDGHAGELWVSSAFPLGRKSLTRLRRREKLHTVEWEAER